MSCCVRLKVGRPYEVIGPTSAWRAHSTHCKFGVEDDASRWHVQTTASTRFWPMESGHSQCPAIWDGEGAPRDSGSRCAPVLPQQTPDDRHTDRTLRTDEQQKTCTAPKTGSAH